MEVSGGYEFELELRHNGSAIEGTMRRTNGDEPVDPVSGSIDFDGTLIFFRVRAGVFEQRYTGRITGLARHIKLEGQWFHDGNPSGTWSAVPGHILPAHNLTGRWLMEVSEQYEFELILFQNGSGIDGTMRRTNGEEPVDPVVGGSGWDGTVRFLRIRGIEEWKQEYQGSVRTLRSGLEMAGTWTHDERPSGRWKAERIGIARREELMEQFIGTWSMTVSGAYEFQLTLQIVGNLLIGNMRRTNGEEPVDPVQAEVGFDGSITITRVRGAGTWSQQFSGQIASGGIVSGSWTHNGVPSGQWSATKER